MKAAIRRYTSATVSTKALAGLRIVFGVLMVVSCVRFIALGWIDEQYVLPLLHFPYQGFEWVASLGAPGMYIVFAVMALAAFGIMVGALYRWSAVVFFLLFTYVELIDKTYYLNHYYFVSIVAFLFILVPANRAWSVDARLRPHIAADAIPRWTVGIFKLQIGILYFFAGIAKMNHDWLINAMPLRIWLPAHGDLPVIGPLMSISWIPWVFSWFGMIYDTTVPFFLLHKRTRPFAYICVILFHVMTGMLFQIGVFPVVLIGMTLIFFEPDLKGFFAKSGKPLSLSNTKMSPRLCVPKFQSVLLAFLAMHFMVQLALPMRYVLKDDDLFWHEEGYRFSWRVMLVEKSGSASFTVTDRATGRKGYVDNGRFLNAHQEKQMAFQPDMILQYAHFLHDHYERHGMTDPIVKAEVWVTMNGEPGRMLVDSSVDLSRQELGFHHNSWVMARD